MSEQTLDMRRSLQIVRRHKIAIGLFISLSILGGAGYANLKPPMHSSEALVVLSASIRDPATQAVIASSAPVLSDALHRIDPPVSLQTLRSRVQVKKVTYNVLSITAQGETAKQAEGTANAVAASYVAYVGSGNAPGGRVVAQVFEPATISTGTPLSISILEKGGVGALVGALLGVVAALAVDRGDRRLRARDDIADSIGVPVLASIPVGRPSNAVGWAQLFADYEPDPVDAWRLRMVLHYLGLSDVRQGAGASLTVISLSSDRKALALGPQFAVFAASLGIPTLLVVGPQQDPRDTAALRAACAAQSPSPRRSRNLEVAVNDDGDAGRLPTAALTVAVAAVHGSDPRIDGTAPTTATVLGVSAGATTAEQLVRVAANAAADGRQLAGILVADPDPSDRTTGRLPQLARSAQRRMPGRITSVATEIRK